MSDEKKWAKFVQLISTPGGLYALDEEGQVWEYDSRVDNTTGRIEHWWKRVSMKRVSS
jgi:hypothetical protein